MRHVRPGVAVTNPNGALGADHELKTVRYLAEVFGREARRPHAEGFLDVGDIHISPFALQAKNWKDTTAALNIGVSASELQAKRAGETYGAAVIKKRNANISEARVAMTLRTFRDLVARLRAAEEELMWADADAFARHAAAHITPKD